MREACLDCVVKHLGQAYVLLMESMIGYPRHRLLVIGHLAEASEEATEAHPELAGLIRQHRLRYQEDMHHKIPFFDIYEHVAMLASFESDQDDIEVPNIPLELYPTGYKQVD